ncbi:hypothetical protein GH733_008651 [Mirounga leonina]|nr:hypothetical protein GH733_008651 [Mirounga leonina]
MALCDLGKQQGYKTAQFVARTSEKTRGQQNRLRKERLKENHDSLKSPFLLKEMQHDRSLGTAIYLGSTGTSLHISRVQHALERPRPGVSELDTNLAAFATASGRATAEKNPPREYRESSVNTESIPIKSSTDKFTTTQHAKLMHNFILKAWSARREINPQNDLTFLQISSKKNEIMEMPQNSPENACKCSLFNDLLNNNGSGIPFRSRDATAPQILFWATWGVDAICGYVTVGTKHSSAQECRFLCLQNPPPPPFPS